ncbi:sulfite reductase, beta subunit (hemoprotein) [Corynebacterium mustelae]|uniref:Sulfite reductase, beta subunit (Hemoprotein) n=1 Tax=Corynebacterium mustelae TaxID=571915 RepID=A0A0G3H458_9CORY|nr:precorrin-3B synthase [Corynebacterium mustelae]AKK05912.1 sulfite reductase, beta subunit (hemoprotein) [Corynebacterium mustelae]
MTTLNENADISVLITSPDRSRNDMCPGAIRLHNAQDGAIGRVRFPGGRVLAQQWQDISRISTNLGDGTIHITTRGNLQFRGVSDDAKFLAAVEDAGFLPSRPHDKIRNILASPLDHDLWPLVTALDNALLANDTVTGLSGRTLFGIDGGSGDVMSRRPDFGVRRSEEGFQLILAGQLQPYIITDDNQVAPLLTKAAALWQTSRGNHWRLRENPTIIASIVSAIADAPGVEKHDSIDIQESPQRQFRPIGWIETGNPESRTVSLGAGLRFGFTSAKVAKILSVIGATTTITPWASLVIHDIPEHDADAVLRVLAPMGLIFDERSPWLRITACTGLPGCAKSLSHTQQDAANLAQSEKIPAGLIHFSGCERRCGHPLSSHTEYVATGDGEYEVTLR